MEPSDVVVGLENETAKSNFGTIFVVVYNLNLVSHLKRPTTQDVRKSCKKRPFQIHLHQ